MRHKEAEDRVRYILTQVPATQDEKIKLIADLITGNMSKSIAFISRDVQLKSLFFNNVGGYANGYVAVPPTHPLHGKHYDNVDIDIHGGLTFSEPFQWCRDWETIEIIDHGVQQIPDDWWVFGFDTMHVDDSPHTWPKERVIEETLLLQKQLEEV